ncbi:MAG: type III-B CRISPR module-associated protein Cmr5 [Lentisphaeria bacterium]
MQNLDQIRAKNALAWAKKIGGGENGGENIAKKIPTMIMENGFIATAAFAKETGKGYEDVFDAIIAHLADENVGKLKQICTLEQFLTWLTSTADSNRLRQITAESLAYLNYLRRFAAK